MLLAVVTLTGFGKVLTFVVMLSVLVVLHELGHFILARRNGVAVNEFSVGMGPRILGWKSPRTGTQYSLRALPIGGYCAMFGEDAKADEAPPSDTNFQAKSAWQRLCIILAGPLSNFVLAYVILLFGALAFGVPSANVAQPVVAGVAHGSPAAIHGLKPGDRIVALNGVAVSSGDVLMGAIHNSLGKPVTIDYQRNGVRYEFDTKPVLCSSIATGPIEPQIKNKGCIGFSPYPAYARVGVGEAFVQSANEYGNIADNVLGGLGLLITHFSQYSSQISGPIGFGQAATMIQDFGWGPYLSLAATISFALGLFNLLPIPALDGGRAAFIIVELIRGKPIDPEREGLVHLAGFAVLMMLMIVVAFHDVSRIVSGQGVF